MSQAERTLAIIKPDAADRRIVGEIVSAIEQAGFRIRGLRMLRLDRERAEGFYAVHRGEPFFAGLVEFMTEGPMVVLALEREDAILKWRELMGATDPANAAEGTIRQRFGTSMRRNCVHGSDAPETAQFELGYFFSKEELY
ncbi:MAG: nucleoside-diphosphate kinase [Bryobacteraceae bacterium]